MCAPGKWPAVRTDCSPCALPAVTSSRSCFLEHPTGLLPLCFATSGTIAVVVSRERLTSERGTAGTAGRPGTAFDADHADPPAARATQMGVDLHSHWLTPDSKKRETASGTPMRPGAVPLEFPARGGPDFRGHLRRSVQGRAQRAPTSARICVRRQFPQFRSSRTHKVESRQYTVLRAAFRT